MNDFFNKFHEPRGRRAIGVIDKDGNLAAEFKSIKDCVAQTGMNRSYVNVLLAKGNKTSLGYGVIYLSK